VYRKHIYISFPSTHVGSYPHVFILSLHIQVFSYPLHTRETLILSELWMHINDWLEQHSKC